MQARLKVPESVEITISCDVQEWIDILGYLARPGRRTDREVVAARQAGQVIAQELSHAGIDIPEWADPQHKSQEPVAGEQSGVAGFLSALDDPEPSAEE